MGKNVKTALIIGGVIIAVLIIVPLASGAVSGWQGYGWGYGMMGPGMTGGYGSMFFMPVLWIVVVGLIVWAVVAAVRRPDNSETLSRSGDSALEILKRRYARGEISQEQFEEMKKALT